MLSPGFGCGEEVCIDETAGTGVFIGAMKGTKLLDDPGITPGGEFDGGGEKIGPGVGLGVGPGVGIGTGVGVGVGVGVGTGGGEATGGGGGGVKIGGPPPPLFNPGGEPPNPGGVNDGPTPPCSKGFAIADAVIPMEQNAANAQHRFSMATTVDN